MKSDWACSTSCSRCSKPLWQTRYHRIGAGKLFHSIAILLRILLNCAYIGIMLCEADCNCNLHLLKYMPYCWQPDHLLDDADSAAKKIGFDRAERSSYTFRSLLAGGAQLAFGSDWPVRNSADISVTEICFFNYQIYSVARYIVPVLQVSDINPMQAIQTAISRKPPGWEVPWIPAECLSLDESLKA